MLMVRDCFLKCHHLVDAQSFYHISMIMTRIQQVLEDNMNCSHFYLVQITLAIFHISLMLLLLLNIGCH